MTDEMTVIRRAQKGDMDAFNELVERSKSLTYRLAFQLTDRSEDVRERAVFAISQLPGGNRSGCAHCARQDPRRHGNPEEGGFLAGADGFR